MARRRILNIHKTCNICSTEQTLLWHKDKWGKIGWVCHNCYNSIVYREEREFSKEKKITRNRPRGLIYNK